jgi:hypothetical protein
VVVGEDGRQRVAGRREGTKGRREVVEEGRRILGSKKRWW